MSNIAPSQPVDTLRALKIEFAQMASLVESHLGDAISAFERRDVASAERVIAGDLKIDAQHRRIENRALAMLQTGPLADRVLREVVTMMKIAGEFERVGDLAKNVAKRTIVLSGEAQLAPIAGVVRMGRASLRQISDILNAYNDSNLTAATAVWGGDGDLDELYNSLFHEIMLAMMKDPGQISACTHLVFIAKNFERIGDHATNIAEAIHYLVTGTPLADNRPKGEDIALTPIRHQDRK